MGSAGTQVPASFHADDTDIECEVSVEILIEYDFDGTPIGCKVEQKWNDFILKTDADCKWETPPSPKQRAVPLAPSHSMMQMRNKEMHGMIGKFSMMQMQQYVIGD